MADGERYFCCRDGRCVAAGALQRQGLQKSSLLFTAENRLTHPQSLGRGARRELHEGALDEATYFDNWALQVLGSRAANRLAGLCARKTVLEQAQALTKQLEGLGLQACRQIKNNAAGNKQRPIEEECFVASQSL